MPVSLNWTYRSSSSWLSKISTKYWVYNSYIKLLPILTWLWKKKKQFMAMIASALPDSLVLPVWVMFNYVELMLISVICLCCTFFKFCSSRTLVWKSNYEYPIWTKAMYLALQLMCFCNGGHRWKHSQGKKEKSRKINMERWQSFCQFLSIKRNLILNLS